MSSDQTVDAPADSSLVIRPGSCHLKRMAERFLDIVGEFEKLPLQEYDYVVFDDLDVRLRTEALRQGDSLLEGGSHESR